MGKFDNDMLGNRMKRYEACYKQQCVPKEAMVLRIDGNSFHTFTKKFKKPFDDLLIDTMQKTLVSLCKDIPNAVFGYTQSDEITIVLVPKDVVKSSDYFEGEVQKILSVTAAKATMYFNKHFFDNINELKNGTFDGAEVVDVAIYTKKLFGAAFDCRVMNIPEFDIYNNLIWRQQDASKNSIQMLGHSVFSDKQMKGVKNTQLLDMLIEHGINWNNLDTCKKRGCCCYKVDVNEKHKKWYLDKDMFILTSDEGREKYQHIVERSLWETE